MQNDEAFDEKEPKSAGRADSGFRPDKRRWCKPGLPHKGWQCVDCEDLCEPVGVCEMCGKTEIRYMHVMHHPTLPNTIQVGCECAERMELTYNGKRAQQRVKNKAARLRTWMKLDKWRVSAAGNLFKKYRRRVVVLVQLETRPEYFVYYLDGKASPRAYLGHEGAARAAFDALNPVIPLLLP